MSKILNPLVWRFMVANVCLRSSQHQIMHCSHSLGVGTFPIWTPWEPCLSEIFFDFRVQRKQCDSIICDVLLERLSVRLAEGSYLLNLFYIFVLRKLRTANCMCSTVIHCYHWCFRKRTNAASAYIIICMITRDVGGAEARCKGNADNYLGICDRLELASILISHFAAWLSPGSVNKKMLFSTVYFLLLSLELHVCRCR